MIARIQTKFDVGDICIYHSKHGYYDSYPDADIKVTITEVHWMLSSDEVVVWYDCESVTKDYLSRFSIINDMSKSYEKYFSEDGEHIPHPIDFEYDFKYNIGDEALRIHADVYSVFPPEPIHITKFVYYKKRTYLDGNVTGCKDEFNIRGYNPNADPQWWDTERSWDYATKNIKCKLPDDYLEKCWKHWKGLSKTDIFCYDNRGYKSEQEKLFDYLGITEQAKQAYDDYKAGKFKESSKKTPREKKASSKKKSKIDSLLEGLTEKEKKALLKKLIE